MMRISLVVCSFGIVCVGCSSTRVLGDAERLQHGLSGVIYDARLCPTELDKARGTLIEAGDCELVTCLPKKGKIVCSAKPEASQKKKR